ncbi:MAG: ABC transporter substrate-binding protein, partial [Acidimicrobiia bacterium]|nr:ABC transporter substrate-binding protein [Acidimicrobiia bacterium]
TEAEDVPQRIVSLSPTHTEILFAIGAGDQVIAVDNLSNHPEEAAAVLTDLSAFEPNVEAISGYEPDLVVLSNEGPIVKQLAKIDIETWIGPAPATLGDAYAQIEQLGALTGHMGDAAEVVSGMETDIAELTSDLPAPERPLTYYHELDDTYYSVTSNTFLGSIYSLFGLRNIADRMEGDSGGYPQLNAEFIVSESPDMIFLADTVCCGQTAETVGARDGWDSIAAVQNGQVIEMNDDIASRWGPRIVDYVRQVRTAFEDAAAVQPASFGSALANRPDRAVSTGQNGAVRRG